MFDQIAYMKAGTDGQVVDDCRLSANLNMRKDYVSEDDDDHEKESSPSLSIIEDVSE